MRYRHGGNMRAVSLGFKSPSRIRSARGLSERYRVCRQLECSCRSRVAYATIRVDTV